MAPVKYAIGIDLGGTSAKYAVVAAPQGEIIFSGSLPTPATEGAPAVLAMLAECIAKCREFAAGRGIELEGAGIGTPGVVSPDGRTVVGAAENIAGWEQVPLADCLEAACGLPVRAANDANAMAMGECRFGAARGLSDVIFVTVGTGIGSAALVDGRLWRGYRGRGMEMGHIAVQSIGGEKCACGGTGCLEHHASTAALVRRYEEMTGHKADGRTIVARYLGGDEAAAAVLNEHWDLLAHGIASMVNIFAPQRVVVGGGISEAGDFYIAELQRPVMAQAMSVSAEGLEIVPARLGNAAGCLGAASLVLPACQ